MMIAGEVECTKCNSICGIDGDLPKIWAWCDVCKDYAKGFDEAAWVADHYAAMADALVDKKKDDG